MPTQTPSAPRHRTLTDYDSAASDFDRLRRPGEATVATLREILATRAPDRPVLSLGCGTGQYEEALFDGDGVVGLDRSRGMLATATARVPQAVCADMVSLPFADASFGAVYFVQSFHHVGANRALSSDQRDAMRRQVLGEVVRVLDHGPVALVQRDPSQNEAVWFWKYFPRALETKLVIQPRVADLVAWFGDLGLADVTATPVDDAMIEGMFTPEAPLSPAFQRAFSEFSYLTDEEREEGSRRLADAIDSGEVHDEIARSRQRFAEIGGTVFVVSGRIRKAPYRGGLTAGPDGD